MKQGDKLIIEKNIAISVLWPNENKLIKENAMNNNSIVCKLNYKNFSILFTGDIEKIAEKEILQEYKNNLNIFNSTVLKVAHHGSNTSSIEKFIHAVNPEVSLIGVGENNNFGHPSEEIIEKIKSYGSKIYRTDENGEISISVNRSGKVSINKFLKQ